MLGDEFKRNKNIMLAYKNMMDGSINTEQIFGRSEADFNTIVACLPRCYDTDPNICLTRKIVDGKGEDRMEVTLIPMRKKLGTKSKVSLYHLVYVEYYIDPDVV